MSDFRVELLTRGRLGAHETYRPHTAKSKPLKYRGGTDSLNLPKEPAKFRVPRLWRSPDRTVVLNFNE